MGGMADNRLFIIDTETGEKFCLCKSYSTGWYVKNPASLGDELTEWLDMRDIDAAYGTGDTQTELILVTENSKEYDSWIDGRHDETLQANQSNP